MMNLHSIQTGTIREIPHLKTTFTVGVHQRAMCKVRFRAKAKRLLQYGLHGALFRVQARSCTIKVKIWHEVL